MLSFFEVCPTPRCPSADTRSRHNIHKWVFQFARTEKIWSFSSSLRLSWLLCPRIYSEFTMLLQTHIFTAMRVSMLLTGPLCPLLQAWPILYSLSQTCNFMLEIPNFACLPKDPRFHFGDLSSLFLLHLSLCSSCVPRNAGYLSRHYLQLGVEVPG